MAASTLPRTSQDKNGDCSVADRADALFPFPEGWYFVASLHSLTRGKLLERQWLGQDIVAWSDDKGSVCVAQSVCPHLGSALGPTVGGRLRDGCLVCPFHGFTYDVAGNCVATPYAPPPKFLALNTYDTRIIQDLVFAWWSATGRPPQWHLPEAPPVEHDWCDLEIRTVRFAGHVQEIAENSVDIAHLRYVHGYGNVQPVGSTAVDGAHLLARFDFTRHRPIAGIVDSAYRVSAAAHLHGLGYSFVDIREHSIGMDLRLWVLATPVDGTLVDLSLASQIREIRRPKRLIVGLGFLPPGFRTRIMNKLVISAQMKDVQQDVVIWQRRRYRPHPRLSRSDGNIGMYRRYCRQFYPHERAGGDG